jgi:hypothetical protein
MPGDPDGFQPVETQIKRDRWGRYVIPDPLTGKERSWTRATTLANTLADRFGLEQWAKRNVVLGIGARQDLYAQAASLRPEDKADLNRIVAEAEAAASSKSSANLGTALHRFTERIDRGEQVEAPEPWDRDLAAYREAMDLAGLMVYPEWIERVLVVPELGVAGTCDRLCRDLNFWPYPRIADLKTGQDVVRYGMTEIALQLAIYANATHWFDPGTGKVHKIEETVDQAVAMVIHLPVGQGRCTLYAVDIEAGWEAVQLAMGVREWRKRKDLAEVVMPALRAVPPLEATVCTRCAMASDGDAVACVHSPEFDQRFDWLRDRVERIKESGHGATLAMRWSLFPDIPTFKRGGPRTDDELETVAGLCELVEMEHGLAFGPSDPTLPVLTKASMKRDAAHA